MTPLRPKVLADCVEKTGDALFARAAADGRHEAKDLTADEVREASQTREALRTGLSEAEGPNALTARIKQVFEGLSTDRAYMIAETEASRARHNGEQIAAQETGLAVRKKWLCHRRARSAGSSTGGNSPWMRSSSPAPDPTGTSTARPVIRGAGVPSSGWWPHENRCPPPT